MNELASLHLSVLPLVNGGERGLAVVSAHPLLEMPRFVAATRMADGTLRAGDGILDDDPVAAILTALDRSTPYSDAAPLLALSGCEAMLSAVLEILRYPHDGRGAARQALTQVLRSNERERIVDTPVVEAFTAVSDPTLQDVMFYSGEGERFHRRRQAAMAFPVLAGRIPSVLSLKMAVDRAKPLLDVVTEHLAARTDGRATRGTVRRLAAVRSPPYPSDLDTIIEFSSRVGTDWVPSDPEDWIAFCFVADAIVGKLAASPTQTASLVKGCGGRWRDYVIRTSAAAGSQRDPDIGAFAAAAHGVAEMIECFSDLVVLPAAAHGSGAEDQGVTPAVLAQASTAARDILIGNRSLPSLVALAARFQSTHAEIIEGTRLVADEQRAALIGDIPEGAWPPLTQPIQASNGLWLVPINDDRSLEWEGGRGAPDPTGAPGLDHCVGGYAAKAIRADSHIVSIRDIAADGTYRRLSTVEFDALSPTSDRLRVIQHRACKNGDPCGAAIDAVAWYMDGIASGRIALHRDRIVAFQDIRNQAFDGIERLCGFDWRNRDTLAAAIVPWAAFLDSDHRRLDLDGFLRHPLVMAVRDEMAPPLILARR